MRVFLTGGTGLIGSHTADALRARGDDVVALCRPGSDRSFLESLGCEIAEGDLGDDADIQAHRMAGCQGVVHSAAHIYSGRSLEAVAAVNVTGTANVLEGAKRAGVGQVVHVSSAAAYGDPPPPITEDTPLDAPLRRIDYYGKTKRAGDLLAQGFDDAQGMRVTVLRPGSIYGERDRLFAVKLVTFLRRPIVFLLGSGNAPFSAVYAGNAADVVLLALDGKGAGDVFNVTHDVDLTQRSLYEALARALGLSPRFIPIPGGLALFGAKVGDAVGIRVPDARELALSRAVRHSAYPTPFVGTKAHEVLGWTARYSLEEAAERTAAWVRQVGL